MKISYKNYIIILLVLIINVNVCFARGNNSGIEVDEPVANTDGNINTSEGIIYDAGNYNYNPINNGIAGFKQDEYDKVNNYEINFDTLDLRIKYFSPNYDENKKNIVNNDIVNNGLRGKDTTNITSNGLDNTNGTLILSMEDLVDTIKIEILNFLSAKNKYDVLVGQKDLYERLHKTAEENLINGLITSLEYNNVDLEVANVNQQLENAKNNMITYRENVAKYLGYKLSEEDKLIFVEPDVDIEKISNVDYETDLNKMFMADSNYIRAITAGDEGSNGSSKLPGSTGNVIYQKKVQAAHDTVEANFERIFANLLNKYRLYVNNLTYLAKIASLRETENESKYNSNLIGESEYLRNKIQILTDRGNEDDSKYELLKAMISYDNSTTLRYID